jgi:hypothetical protein
MNTYGKVEVWFYTRWRRMVSFKPHPPYPRYTMERRVNGSQSRSGHFGVENISCFGREPKPGYPVVSLSLYRLSCFYAYFQHLRRVETICGLQQNRGMARDRY